MADAVDSAIDMALLKLAKGLLAASDELSRCHPQAAEKLARKAYLIARDISTVRRGAKTPEKPRVPPLLLKPSKRSEPEQPASDEQTLSGDGSAEHETLAKRA